MYGTDIFGISEAAGDGTTYVIGVAEEPFYATTELTALDNSAVWSYYQGISGYYVTGVSE